MTPLVLGMVEWTMVQESGIKLNAMTLKNVYVQYFLYPFTFLPFLTSISNPLMFSHTHPHSLTVRMAREISHGRRMEPAKK